MSTFDGGARGKDHYLLSNCQRAVESHDFKCRENYDPGLKHMYTTDYLFCKIRYIINKILSCNHLLSHFSMSIESMVGRLDDFFEENSLLRESRAFKLKSSSKVGKVSAIKVSSSSVSR